MAATPTRIEIDVLVHAAPQRIWDRLVDWEGLGSWMLEGTGFEVKGSQREGVGTRATAMIKIAGIKTEDPIEVTRWEPPELLEIQHLGWVKGTGTIRLAAQDDGTHVTWTESLIPPWGPLGALGIRVFKPMMRKVFLRDLLVLKAQLEDGASRVDED